ncbi:sialoadhesin-like [Ylistrum balloti]|uniref:sialoadhesin-like n=1 Tax=Ylistrum balloti TaxID=509963 RepID=UPI002905CF67|nr:sialoadhesin-like [Ylistrum balloti]
MTGHTVVCYAFNTDEQTQATRRPALNIQHIPAILVSPIDDPYVITEGQKNVTLTCVTTSANPRVTSLVWTREASMVSDSGVYRLPVITQDHAGVYTCSAMNAIGTTTSNITLKVLTSPPSPNIVGFTDVTSSTLTVKWTPSDKGAMTNIFNITHGCKGCSVLGSAAVDLTDEDIYSYTLTNLVPKSQYYVNIKAINMAGTSSPLELIVSTSPADTCRSPLEYASSGSTALLVVGVILLLIAAAVFGISGFLYKKSRSFSRSKNQNEKSVVFSSVRESIEDKPEASMNCRSHYQELDPSDMNRPSPYESLPKGNKEAVIEGARKNSLRIAGLEDISPKVTAEECVEKIVTFVNDKLNVSLCSEDIDVAHRLGKFSKTKPRNVIVKFVRRRKRHQIIKSRRKLKGTGYTVSEDLTRLNQQKVRDAYSLDYVKNSYSLDGKLFVVLDNGVKRCISIDTPLYEDFLKCDENFGRTRD